MKLLLMGMLVLMPASIPAVHEEPKSHSCPRQALFLVHKGQIQAALELYENHYQTFKKHDTDFLQQLGISLLEQGSKSNDAEIQLMSLFGAGIAMNEMALPVLGRAVNSANPTLQLVALNFLSRYHEDEAERYLLQALQSNFLIVRLEALHQLALKRHPKASNHIESLMGKVDATLLPLFPQLLGLVDDIDSTKMLKKLLNHPDEDVRLEAIISCANSGRDDFLPKIRILAKHSSPALQEASALALGELRDESSLPLLKNLKESSRSLPAVRLAALKALQSLGKAGAFEEINAYAKMGNPFAISMLGDISGAEEMLFSLLSASDFTIKANAAISLLNLKDSRCVPLLGQILVKDSRDLIFSKVTSQGKGLSYWKPITSARQQCKDSTIELELSLHFREALLIAAADLQESDFLKITTIIFEKQQSDLVPVAIELLEKIQTPKCIEQLKKYRQRPGAPLIRNYCNLALYRLGEEGPYSENLMAWMDQQVNESLIQLRPYVPWEMDDEHAIYQITPHETSRLLVDSFEALARKQDNNGINCLLKAIKNGNQKNKYALAGLLIRAAI